MGTLPRKEFTTKQVAGVRFGFFTEEEIQKLSVKRIVNPHTYDNLKQPVVDGLYDAALGPIDLNGKCSTCQLNHHNCPGHFGHIELPLPVYNPLVFNTLYKLVRGTCLHCFKLKLSDQEVAKYEAKLEKLLSDDLVTAAGMSHSKAPKSKDMDELDESDLELDMGKEGYEEEPVQQQQQQQQEKAKGSRRRPVTLTAQTLDALREVLGDLMRALNPTRCANCKAISPTIRKQGVKLFQVWTSAKALQQNIANGTVIQPVLGGSGSEGMAAAEQEMAAALQAEQDSRKRKRGGDDGAQEEKDENDDGEDGGYDDEKKDVKGGVKGEKKEEGELDVFDLEAPAAKGKAKGKVAKGGKKQKVEAPEVNFDRTPKYMSPSDVYEILRRLWSKEWRLLQLIYDGQAAAGSGVAAALAAAGGSPQDGFKQFFVRLIAVTPNKFRPPSMMNGESYEHPQNMALQSILSSCLDLHEASAALLDPSAETHLVELGRYMTAWYNLQQHVCALIDSSTADNAGNPGVRQQLEKKEGLFRKNMMGKRVNFAARSVISPDPYISAGEIGVPPYFAKRLSFPEQVTPWNVERLRALVVNGPDVHPGAVAVEDEQGRVVVLGRLSREKREALAKQLLAGYTGGVGAKGPSKVGKSAGRGGGMAGIGKIVYRHLQDGDIMLTNRQPTLHKPGLMAHKARVLKGERTIRMHYANCATFNADFDGDEINLHLPQDHLGRAEGFNIVHADHQFIVPTDGKPIRGLIQDHVVAATLLTKRDTWLERPMYTQLVHFACNAWRPGKAQNVDIVLQPPAVLKPRAMWSGKQVVATVVEHFTRPAPPLTFTGGSKVPVDYWGKGSGEGELVFRQGYLVAGCVDKAQFGKYGLVHAVQELYGNAAAGELLSAFSRLFTHYLQWHGFTCGMDDLLLVEAAERRRAQILQTADAVAVKASAEFAGVEVPAGVLAAAGEGRPGGEAALMQQEAQVRASLAQRYRSNKETGAAHDMKASGAMHPLSSEVIKACLPSGQVKPFPDNCLSLMTVTGAKGSMVNFSQISCLLGQQELEGRRVPRMSSGKTLPCFRPYDAGARSGGFIGDRFLTGLRPQEYYFHCMAGREGLVDTAVKTSRSGYLQRCLVKNLEALRVHYDCSVRDNADGSVVQFYYGEDGLDVTQTSYMRQFGFLAANADCFAQRLDVNQAAAASAAARLTALEAEVEAAASARRRLQARVAKGKGEAARQLAAALPAMASQPPTLLGCVSEAFGDALCGYLAANPDGLLRGKKGAGGVDASLFERLMQLKFMRSLVAPGEAVGVLAAQSVGEPSTQMTLNTFHMAGRGEANVTLGIPRLREILMTAAARIKTPVMTLPLVAGRGVKDARVVANRMRKLRLAECLAGISVEETPVARLASGGYGRLYMIRLQFHAESKYPAEAQLKFDELAECFSTAFCPLLKEEIKRQSRKKGAGVGKLDMTILGEGEEGGVVGGAGNEDDEVDGGRAAAARARKKSEKADDFEEDEADEEMVEGKMRFAGGRGERATYEGPDQEDLEVVKEADKQQQEEEEGEEEEEEAAAAASKKKAAGKGGKAAAEEEGGGSSSITARVDRQRCLCEVQLSMELAAPKLLMLEVAEKVAAQAMVRSTAGIDRCYVIEGQRGEPTKVQTDGINFQDVWANSDILDLNALTTNDVGAMLRTYGVEAARATILRECRAVFGAYGIGVDVRHLSLIADFMTHQGGYRPCNRIGIESSASPFLKMSFETAAHFLTDASMKGSYDNLKTPAARLCVGRVVELGTGCVEVMQKL